MASIDTLERATGPAYRVRWRHNGAAAAPVILKDRDQAETFRRLVDMAGQDWPTPGQLRAHGLHDLADKAARESRPALVTVTLIEYCSRYIDDHSVASKDNRAKYHRMIANHMAEFFGAMRLVDVTGRDILNWQTYMGDEESGLGLSPKSIKNTRCAILAPALNAACKRDLDGNPPMLAYNPCESVPAPKVSSKRPSVWTQEELDAVLAAAYAIDPRAWALLLTLAGTGMRWSEVVALTTHAVYRDRGLIEVRQVARKDVRSQWRLHEAAKTNNAFRMVATPGAVFDVLAAQGAADGALVLTNAEGGLWRHETFFDNQWAKVRAAVRAAGYTRHLTLHGLRHTAATRLIDNGVGLFTVSGILGHAPGTTATMYGGRTGAGDAAAAVALGTLVSGKAA